MRTLLAPLAGLLLVTAVVVACGGSSSDGGGGSSGGSSSGGGSSSSSGSVYSTEEKKGIATFYDADGSGNCSYEASPGDLDVVALDFPEYAGSAACGSCLRVQGPKGSITVRVVDSCPPCEDHHMDLSAEAFAKIANPDDGRVDVTYQTVACDVSGPIAYRYKEGSSQYWTAIQVRNHRVPVAKLEYQRDGAWVEMKREDYNYFVEDKGVGPGGVKVRVTSADGQVLEDALPAVEEGKVEQGKAQFR